MKKSIFFTFSWIAQILSKEIHKNSISLREKNNINSQISLSARTHLQDAFQGFLEPDVFFESYDNSYLLALILKDQYKNNMLCQKILEERCEYFKKIGLKADNICGNKESLCNQNYVDFIDTSCQKLSQKIITMFNGNSQEHDCNKLQDECLFLEGSCAKSLTEPCNKLKDFCYREKRDQAINTILLAAMRGQLTNENTCESNIKKVCLILARENVELMHKCLWKEATCKNLIKISKKGCTFLKEELENTINLEATEKKCTQLLYSCYLHILNYENDAIANKIKKQCLFLQEKCRKFNNYDILDNYFSLIESEISLVNKISLSKLYDQFALYGVIITKQEGIPDIFYILGLLIQEIILDYRPKDPYEVRCKELLENNCSSFDYMLLELKTECEKINTNTRHSSCKKMRKKLESYCNILKKNLVDKGLALNTNRSGIILYTEILSWYQLKTNTFTTEECMKLQSECYYLQELCPGRLGYPCRNLRALCYKKSYNAALILIFERLLRGNLNKELNSNSSPSLCIISLIEKCKNMKNKNSIYAEKCLYPEEICREIVSAVEMKCSELKNKLLGSNYFQPKECHTLLYQCKELFEDCNSIFKNLCISLRKHCEFLDSAKLLKNLLLAQMDNSLSSQNACEKKLRSICSSIENLKNVFIYQCKNQRRSCEIMLKQILENCFYFNNNFKNSGIAITLENGEITKEECLEWETYCNMLRQNCPENLDEKCNILRNSCSKFGNPPKPTPIPDFEPSSTQSELEPTSKPPPTSTSEHPPTSTSKLPPTSTSEPRPTSPSIKPTSTTEDQDDITKGCGIQQEGFHKKVLICLITGIMLGVWIII
ncbi:hypothetical protein PCANB_001678 [Pneumocystis canis]|nr:hypothetical protein PCANB_001678 [Pneumocystis canis]